MIEIVKLYTSRDEYDIRLAAERSLTVGELIDELKRMDENAKVVFDNDNGYTYGYVCSESVDSDMYETREEEERREAMEELNEELTELQAEYENPFDEDERITDEKYREMRETLFKEYGITEEEYNAYNF